MRVWAFAARQARAGHWERHALDRERFKRRIADVDMAVSWVLKPQHRSLVMFQRFMPWWNAQKRKELAEKKQKEMEEKNAEENNKISDMSHAEIVKESGVNVDANGKSGAKIVTDLDEKIKINKKSDDKIISEPDVNINNVKEIKITSPTEVNDRSKKIVNGFKSNIVLLKEPANICSKSDNTEKDMKNLKETHKVLTDNEVELIDDKINALKLGIPGKDRDALTT
ncbi:unnamed protein product [Parnassius apollo]|uniref:(apollo) hypothetical protein n=1 Tax=Parnassius apollo TaxID=110799 RepID=A0A8S3WBH5_PARAO|nr:unnamed protein product [Parnassius apollo]